jgi:regulation of enolase protein 1 (concanavalin A-like superfamily)
MLHQKSTKSFYREIEPDLQYLSTVEQSNPSDYALYEILAEYDEMQRKIERDSDKGN